MKREEMRGGYTDIRDVPFKKTMGIKCNGTNCVLAGQQNPKYLHFPLSVAVYRTEPSVGEDDTVPRTSECCVPFDLFRHSLK
jgi:hypothetical protein